MKIKLRNILDGLDALGNLYNQKLPGVVAHRLSKTIEVVKSELKTFNEVREKLLKEYAKLDDEAGAQYIFETDEQREQFDQQINEILDKEVEEIKPILTEKDMEKIEATPAELATISWLIE